MNAAERAELTALLPPPGDPQLPDDRGRVLKDAFLREIGRPRRPVLLVPVTAAALVIVVVALAAVVLRGSHGERAPAPAAAAVIEVPAVHTAGVTALADRTAAAASPPATPPLRPDQFAYIQSRSGYRSVAFGRPFSAGASPHFAGDGPGVVTHALDNMRIREMWLPEVGYQAFVRDGAETFDVYAATSNRTYASLPTDPAKLLRRAYAETRGMGPGPDYSAFDWIGEALRETLLPPQVRIALYRAAARIPGVVLVDDAVDAAGRHGTAVAFEDQNERREWIFDRGTFEYLGERNYLVEKTADDEAGTITGISAVLRRAVVDSKGRQPR